MKRIVEGIATTQRHPSVWTLVGDRLRARRAHLGLGLDTTAEQLGVEASAYERFEEGSDQAPAALLAEAADLFGVPVLWFFQDVTALDGKDDAEPGPGQAPVYQVATEEDRIQALANYFRQLDFAGQQHLLTIARALSRAAREPSGEVVQFGSKDTAPKVAPRRLRRSPSLHNPSRKSN
jgi:transcriptional regulator with XRE-family HTH domain